MWGEDGNDARHFDFLKPDPTPLLFHPISDVAQNPAAQFPFWDIGGSVGYAALRIRPIY